MKKLKIAYLSLEGPEDKRAWSGTVHNMYNCILKTGHEVVASPSYKDLYKWRTLFYKAIAKLRGKHYENVRDEKYLELLTNKLTEFLEKENPDIIFSCGSTYLAKLKSQKPKVLWADATFELLQKHTYHVYRLLPDSLKIIGDMNERLALTSARKNIYTSDWVKNSAINYYKIDSNKIEVIKFGANLPFELNREEILERVKQRREETIELLFMGVEWIRKGLPKVLETVRVLNERGLKTQLTIAGSNPPIEEKYRSYCRVIGFIPKYTDEGWKKYKDLFMNSHLFFMPSKIEGFGLVFAEAAAFGVPSISNRNSSIPSAVVEGKSGLLLEDNSTPEEYADLISNLMGDKERYQSLCFSARETYEKELNWDVASNRLKQIFEELVQ